MQKMLNLKFQRNEKNFFQLIFLQTKKMSNELLLPQNFTDSVI